MNVEKHLLTTLKRAVDGSAVSESDKQAVLQWLNNMILQAKEHGCTEAEVVRSILGLAYDVTGACQCSNCSFYWSEGQSGFILYGDLE